MSIMFSNFSMPSSEFTNGPMELSIDNKITKFDYPLSEPLKITLSPKFLHEPITLTIFAINPKDKKNKILSRGNLVLHKAIFVDKKTTFDKVITMIPPSKTKDMKKMGKINIEIKLLIPFDEWLKGIKKLGKKSNSIKYSKPNSPLNSNNIENDKEIINKKIFDDDLSNVSFPELEEEDTKGVDLNQLIDSDNIKQLKEVLQDNYEQILPKDISALKEYNEQLYKKYQELSTQYNQILSSLDSSNENIKNKAIQYWNNYKNLKKDFYKNRIELKSIKKELEKETIQDKKDKEILEKDIQNVNDEKEVFFNTLVNKDGIYDESNLVKITSGNDNNDIRMLSEALKKISSLGINIIEGLNISEEERKILSVITGINFENYPTSSGENGSPRNEEEVSLSNKIVALIERDVNDLYMKKIIKAVTINQIDVTTYSFSDSEKTENVSFKIKDNGLICSSGETFTNWLKENFKL